ncbi:23S rRNA (uracil1939-C5)-methyltransferase [Sulfobacillus thermosulfidooxidans DSM 9293]|uniref:23S rRNA (Uracil1939-C5)-methyltransferase n=1 Tax=Sulfobacillus thermosulfidooxidans (strain DSM 9293 / VKM B-1269 / AT-1) TaxID=929705 RepID=A0A1W1WII1_SULTA|nr:23S rRNA (uracil(1939)-C(5))-methyltransferase RlmD [Sulfobacillus thermosulfidooxidans]SMC05533.1 23S rRNA (uracil1939-C5)-methyltransferase [Sulfobacillus thermosulfidooxidans DSM 9293]
MDTTLPKEIEVQIDRMGQNGQGIAYLPDGRIFFVDGALPGERVRAQLTQVKSQYARGTLNQVLQASPSRIESGCSYFEQCGGCAFQHWDYQQELQYKENWVRQALKRIGKVDAPPVEQIVAAPSADHYRNKGQFPWGYVDGKLRLGLYQSRSHELVPLDNCLIQDQAISKMLEDLPRLVAPYRLSAYDESTGKGLLRHVLIRTSKWSHDMLVLFVVTKQEPRLKNIAEELRRQYPHIAGVGININAERTNRILGTHTELLAGTSTIIDKILDMSFYVSFESFFQVNPEQVSTLYQLALKHVPENAKIVWDLYAGVGTLATLMSPKSQAVYAIEINPQAAADAKKNFALNHLSNVSIIAAPVEEIATRHQLPNPEIVVMDPPRKGVDASVLQTLKQLAPERIIYVSCNPDTLARDIALLRPDYELQSVTPVDMFPRTDHVESCSLLIKKP